MSLWETVTLPLISWGSSGAMVFGGVVPYIPQYLDIRMSKSSEGFSTHVCLVLLIANILRILFWFGHPFELPLLWQSIIMVAAMLVMLHVCIRTKTDADLSTHRRHFLDFDRKYFWKWSRFRDYTQFLMSFTVTMIMLTALLSEFAVYVETLGFVSLVTEAMLGLPQFYHNFTNKSTIGMSVKMVCFWFSGDTFKTIYFLVKETPAQFWICGCLQITIDIAILCQVVLYRGSGKREMRRP